MGARGPKPGHRRGCGFNCGHRGVFLRGFDDIAAELRGRGWKISRSGVWAICREAEAKIKRALGGVDPRINANERSTEP